MFGHWVVLQVTATWGVSHAVRVSPRGLWKQCPWEVLAWWHLRQCHRSVPGPLHTGPRPLARSRRPPHQPSSAFYTQSLGPALPSWWVWCPPQHSRVGTSGKGTLEADPSSAGLCMPIWVWSWFGSSRCHTVCTENLWNQSLSVRELKLIMKQPYSHYCSLSILWCRNTTHQLRMR